MRGLTRYQSMQLDRYITGNYGEDSVPHSVVVMPSAWEWVCPYCDEVRVTQIEKGDVLCPGCGVQFEAEIPDICDMIGG